MIVPLSNHSTTFGPPDVPLSAGSTLPVFGVNSDEVSVWELSLWQEHFRTTEAFDANSNDAVQELVVLLFVSHSSRELCVVKPRQRSGVSL